MQIKHYYFIVLKKALDYFVKTFLFYVMGILSRIILPTSIEIKIIFIFYIISLDAKTKKAIRVLKNKSSTR